MFQFSSVFEYFIKGGPIFMLLALISVLSLTLIVERIMVYRAIRKSSRKLAVRIKEAVEQSDTYSAILACVQSQSPASALFKAIIERAGKTKAVIEEAAERNSGKLTDALNRNLTFLATTGSITPFIGLFGTVLGIINAFTSISQAKAFAPSLVAAGIAEALLNTAAGLFVAIPAVTAYNLFLASSKRLQRELSNASSEIIEIIAGDTK